MKNLICMFLMGILLVLSTGSCSDSNMPKDAEVTKVAVPDTKPVPTINPKKEKNLNKMPWVSLNEVEALVRKEPKKLIVDVYTPWCGPCKMMDRNTFSDADIIKQMGDNFYPIKFNAEGPDPIKFMGKEYTNPQYDPNRRGRNGKHQLSSFFAVRGYPSLVVMDEQFKIIGKIVGYRTPEQLKGDLEQYMN